MKVRQLMTTDVAMCVADDSASQAARLMWERDCGFVPVVESRQDPCVVGVVTDRDVCMAAYTKNRPLDQIRLRELMSTALHTCRAGENVAAADDIMRRAQVRRLPVVDDAGRLVGVVSLADIAREAARRGGARRSGVSLSDVGKTVAVIDRPRDGGSPAS